MTGCLIDEEDDHDEKYCHRLEVTPVSSRDNFVIYRELYRYNEWIIYAILHWYNIIDDETNYCTMRRDILESFKCQSVLSNEPNRLANSYNPDHYYDDSHD